MSELERQNGFLTVDFKDDSQLAAINEDVTVIVAVQENALVGYVCATCNKSRILSADSLAQIYDELVSKNYVSGAAFEQLLFLFVWPGVRCDCLPWDWYLTRYEITHSLNMEGVIKVYSQQAYQRTLVMLLEDFGGESLKKLRHSSPELYSPMPLAEFLGLAI